MDQQDPRTAAPIITHDRVSLLSQQAEYDANAHVHRVKIDIATATTTVFSDKTPTAQIGFNGAGFSLHLHPTAFELRLLASAYTQAANMLDDLEDDRRRGEAIQPNRKTDMAMMATEGGAQ